MRPGNIWKRSREALLPPPCALGLDTKQEWPPPPTPPCLLASPLPRPLPPRTAPAHPCHVKGGRRGAGSREGTWGWLGWGWGPWISRKTGPKLPPDNRHCRPDGPKDTSTPSTQCLDYLFRTPNCTVVCTLVRLAGLDPRRRWRAEPTSAAPELEPGAGAGGVGDTGWAGRRYRGMGVPPCWDTGWGCRWVVREDGKDGGS